MTDLRLIPSFCSRLRMRCISLVLFLMGKSNPAYEQRRRCNLQRNLQTEADAMVMSPQTITTSLGGALTVVKGAKVQLEAARMHCSGV